MSRDALFDLAINRALSYALRLGLPLEDDGALYGGLELWYLKTRFAYRIPLDDVVATLRSYPGKGSWQGGAKGSWQENA